MAPAENQADPAQIELDLEADDQIAAVIPPEGDEDGAVVAETKPDEVAELKKQLEESNRARADAESRVSSLTAEKSVSDTRLANEVNGRFAAVEQAIDVRGTAAKAAIATIKQEMVRAAAEQRYEDQADLQEKMADAKLEERAANNDKAQLTAHKERLKQEIETAATRQTRDPVEQFISNIPGDRSKQWLRDHPEILRKVAASPADAKRLYGYANIAEANGNAPDSDGYFDSIEEQFGLKETPTIVTKPSPKDPGRTAAAAPATRSAPAAQGDRIVKLDDVIRKLSANSNDRANAKISFPDKTPDEAMKLYAEGLVKSKQREPNFRPDIRL